MLSSTLKYCRARCDMLKVFKTLQGYCDNFNNIILLPHIGVASRVKNINCIEVLLNLILENTDLLIEQCPLIWHSSPDGVANCKPKFVLMSLEQLE